MIASAPTFSQRAVDETAARLGHATLGYLIAITLVITLSPFHFAWTPVHGFTYNWQDRFDIAMNMVMFVPLGFMFRLTRPRGIGAPWWHSLLLGAALSVIIETVQLFEATRFSSLVDIAANIAGAGLGAWCVTVVTRRLRVGVDAVRILALELPLMGLAYLLVPLCWLVGLASGGTSRAWLVLPIAACGGAILGAIHGGYLEPVKRFSRTGLLVAGGAWFAVAVLPGTVNRLELVVAGVAVTLGSAWLRSVATAHQRAHGGDRRFELPTLRLVLPLFVAYLALSSLWPLSALGSTWHAGIALLLPGVEVKDAQVYLTLEHVAAFTLVGYVAAEFYGRADTPYSAVAWRVSGSGLLLGALLEIARGWHAQFGASLLLGLFAVAASVFGGWMYHLQRDYVRALLGYVPPEP